MILRILALAAAGAASLSADALKFGFRGGVPLTKALESSGRFKTLARPYTFGPTMEIHLRAGLAITADLLYRRVAAEDAGQVRDGSRWDIPVMLRYRGGVANVRPFIGGGLLFHRISKLAVTNPEQFVKTTSNGLVVGAGIELRLPGVAISPEVRYSHRANDNVFSLVGGVLRANKNQVDFLAGFTF